MEREEILKELQEMFDDIDRVSESGWNDMAGMLESQMDRLENILIRCGEFHPERDKSE